MNSEGEKRNAQFANEASAGENNLRFRVTVPSRAPNPTSTAPITRSKSRAATAPPPATSAASGTENERCPFGENRAAPPPQLREAAAAPVSEAPRHTTADAPTQGAAGGSNEAQTEQQQKEQETSNPAPSPPPTEAASISNKEVVIEQAKKADQDDGEGGDEEENDDEEAEDDGAQPAPKRAKSATAVSGTKKARKKVLQDVTWEAAEGAEIDVGPQIYFANGVKMNHRQPKRGRPKKSSQTASQATSDIVSDGVVKAGSIISFWVDNGPQKIRVAFPHVAIEQKNNPSGNVLMVDGELVDGNKKIEDIPLSDATSAPDHASEQPQQPPTWYQERLRDLQQSAKLNEAFLADQAQRKSAKTRRDRTVVVAAAPPPVAAVRSPASSKPSTHRGAPKEQAEARELRERMHKLERQQQQTARSLSDAKTTLREHQCDIGKLEHDLEAVEKTARSAEQKGELAARQLAAVAERIRELGESSHGEHQFLLEFTNCLGTILTRRKPAE